MLVNDIDERIKDILADTKEGLTKDSAAAIVFLEDDIFEKKCIIELIKVRKLTAIYEGDKTKPYDPDKFLIVTKDNAKKEISEIENDVDKIEIDKIENNPLTKIAEAIENEDIDFPTFKYKCDKCGIESSWSIMVGLPLKQMPCGCSGSLILQEQKLDK